MTLSGADLTGVTATYANFYSLQGFTAMGDATMTGVDFSNAYLAGANFTGASLEGSHWTQAVLVGANFSGAKLGKNTIPDQPSVFEGAYVQGANFTNATATAANFSSSYWDLTGPGTGSGAVTIELQPDNLQFNGYWNAPGTPICVEANYSDPSLPPATSSENYCPTAAHPPPPATSCTGLWEMPKIPIDQAIPKSGCTGTDIFWSLGGF